MDNQQELQNQKGKLVSSQFPTFSRFFSELLTLLSELLRVLSSPYLILWISANGMIWLPLFSVNIIWGNYGSYEDEYPIIIWGLAGLACLLITVYSFFVYRARYPLRTKRILGIGFLIPAILGGILNIPIAMSSISSTAVNTIGGGWFVLLGYTIFFIIGLANIYVAKRVIVLGIAAILIVAGALFPDAYFSKTWKDLDEKARLEGLATRSECGNGICEGECRKEAIESGACRSEDPKNCPSDCAVRCDWIANERRYQWTKTQGDYLCKLYTASVPDNKFVKNAPYGSDLLKANNCDTAYDCPPGHTCATVDLNVLNDGDPTEGRICLVNPVPEELLNGNLNSESINSSYN